MSGVLLVKLLAAILVSTAIVGSWLGLSHLIKSFSARRALGRKSESTSSTPTGSPSSAGPTSSTLRKPGSVRRLLNGVVNLLRLLGRIVGFGRKRDGIRISVTPENTDARLNFALAAEIAQEAVKLTVQAIKCPLCGCTIYSRARHDFRSCKCGAVSVDGGFDYMKCAWDQNRVPPPVAFEMKVDATKKELYDDWNRHIDTYGLIPPVVGDAPAPRTKRPRTRRAPAVDRKPAASRRKNPRSRK